MLLKTITPIIRAFTFSRFYSFRIYKSCSSSHDRVPLWMWILFNLFFILFMILGINISRKWKNLHRQEKSLKKRISRCLCHWSRLRLAKNNNTSLKCDKDYRPSQGMLAQEVRGRMQPVLSGHDRFGSWCHTSPRMSKKILKWLCRILWFNRKTSSTLLEEIATCTSSILNKTMLATSGSNNLSGINIIEFRFHKLLMF